MGLIKNNPLADCLRQVVEDTKELVKQMENLATELEEFTKGKGIQMMKESVGVAHAITALGADWGDSKKGWARRAERFANKLSAKVFTTDKQLRMVEILVDQIISGCTDFIQRARKLATEAEKNATAAEALKSIVQTRGDEIVKKAEAEKKKQRLHHLWWLAGPIAGAIATGVVEGKTIPDINNSIKQVKTRVGNCSRIWNKVAIVSRELTKTLEGGLCLWESTMDTWIKEARAIRSDAKNYRENYEDFLEELADSTELIDAFKTLNSTLQAYA